MCLKKDALFEFFFSLGVVMVYRRRYGEKFEGWFKLLETEEKKLWDVQRVENLITLLRNAFCFLFENNKVFGYEKMVVGVFSLC